MRLGYNTNGFAHHCFEDSLAILAEIGYESVAVTLDHHVLNPLEPSLPDQLERTNRLLEQYRMKSVIETGARFLLDSRVKHHPTLMSNAAADRGRRIDFLTRAIDIAAALGSDAVSFWSGALSEGVSEEVGLDRLVAGCSEVLEHAMRRNVRLAFEPEPGMFVARMEDFRKLSRRLEHPLFGLTLDVGHIHCLDDGVVPQVLEDWGGRLFNVHIEDMRRGVHEHLIFGDGEIDFPPIMAKLSEIGYAGGVHVELSRHSHDAVQTARRAYQFLRGLGPSNS
jgi:sugar phosphate isomerase/epimerase